MSRKSILWTALAATAALALTAQFVPLMCADIYYRRALAAARAGEMKRAERLFTRSLFFDDDNAEVYRSLGDLYAAAAEEEMDAFYRVHMKRKVIRAEPPVKITQVKNGEVYEEAVPVRELSPADVRRRLRAGSPGKPAGRREIIYEYPPYPGSARGWDRKAAAAYLHAVRLNPLDGRNYEGCARMIQFIAPFEKTRALFRKAIGQDPANPNFRFSYALFLIRSGKRREGMDALRTAVAIYPFEARKAYAAWCRWGGGMDDLFSIAGGSPTALWYLGLFFESRNEKARAADAFLAASRAVGGNSDYRFPAEHSPEILLPLLLKKLSAYGYTDEREHYRALWNIRAAMQGEGAP